jgi:hypothetical protein
MVKAGDSIPSVELVEKAPSNKVSLAKELASGKGLIVGVPAAFSEYSARVDWDNPCSAPGDDACLAGASELQLSTLTHV